MSQEFVDNDETSIVKPVIRTQDAITDLKAFDDLKAQLLSSTDYQNIQGKNFIKKSGWRKLALVFNISDEVVHQDKLAREDGSFVWSFRVRAKAPNGRHTEAVGSCDSRERKFAHTEHDVQATAHTRAKSRAISDMIGAGEISAEEIDYDSPVEIQPVTSMRKTTSPKSLGNREQQKESTYGNLERPLSNTASVTQKILTFEFKLGGVSFPVREEEEPFSRFFIGKVCKDIASRNPNSKYDLVRNSSDQITGMLWHNIDESEQKEITNTLMWTLRKVEQNRMQAKK